MERTDIIDLEGEMVIMPTSSFYEAVFYGLSTKFVNDDYQVHGILFLFSSGEIYFDYRIRGDWFEANKDKMGFLVNSDYKDTYMRHMIFLIFNGTRLGD